MQFNINSIEKEVHELEFFLIQYLLTKNESTNEIISHIFKSGGKRLRPVLFYLCSKLVGYDGDHLHPIAAVCEYIHTASLLHDDVIDNSKLRRNKPTVNSIWGDETAVLSGDLIYSTACRLMVKTRSLDLIDCFAECIRYMSESELFQLELLWKLDTTKQDYLRLVEGKTACLFEASCKAPGYLLQIKNNKSYEDTIKSLSIYGKNLGTVFQIMDDCLDYSMDEASLGKPVAQDLLQGKVTLPLLFALENCKNDQLKKIVSKIVDGCENSSEIKNDLVTLVNKNNGLQCAMEFCAQYLLQAKSEIAKVFENSEKTKSQKFAYEALIQICESALERKN